MSALGVLWVYFGCTLGVLCGALRVLGVSFECAFGVLGISFWGARCLLCVSTVFSRPLAAVAYNFKSFWFILFDIQRNVIAQKNLQLQK